MSSRVARFLLLFAALWLPVQSMAAMSMPLCRHAQEQAMPPLTHAAGEHGGVPCHESVPDQAAHDAGCDNCEMCHMAGASFIPSAALVTGLIPAGRHFASPAIAAPPSHVIEPPQHPPRSSA